jgi:hypothetical protein
MTAMLAASESERKPAITQQPLGRSKGLSPSARLPKEERPRAKQPHFEPDHGTGKTSIGFR